MNVPTRSTILVSRSTKKIERYTPSGMAQREMNCIVWDTPCVIYLLDRIEVTEATMIDVRLSSVLQNDIVETPRSAPYDPYPGRWKREGILAICSDDININPTKVRRVAGDS